MLKISSITTLNIGEQTQKIEHPHPHLLAEAGIVLVLDVIG